MIMEYSTSDEGGHSCYIKKKGVTVGTVWYNNIATMILEAGESIQLTNSIKSAVWTLGSRLNYGD